MNDSYSMPISLQCNRSGYILAGWANSATATSADYIQGFVANLTESLTVYAVWRSTDLSIVYDANVGLTTACMNSAGTNLATAAERQSTVTVSRNVVPFKRATAPVCLPAGFTLKAWNTRGDGTGTSYSLTAGVFAPSTYAGVNSVTLYAEYTPTTACPEYSIGDKGPGGGTVFYTGATECLEAAPSGWGGPRSGGKDPSRMWGDAVREAKAYLGGGKRDWVLPSKEQLNALYEQRVAVGGLLPERYWSNARTGEVVWTRNFGDGSQVNWPMLKIVRARPIRSFTSTAAAPTFALTYDANGGTCTATTSTAVASGASVTLPASDACTRTGYSLAGWASAATAETAEFTPGQSVSVTSSKTLYAVWRSTDLTIVYDAAVPVRTACKDAPGTSVTTVASRQSTSSVSRSGTATLAATSPCRPSGRVLSAWNTKGDGTGTSYPLTPGGFTPSIYSGVDSVTLYAKYTVSTKCADYSVGDTGPGGGIVFSTSATQCLEAAPSGWNGDSADPTTDWKGASPLAARYGGGGKSDWFLPSTRQLEALYAQKGVVGGFATNWYWSSQSLGNNIAASLNFSRGEGDSRSKTYSYGVRPIRSFPTVFAFTANWNGIDTCTSVQTSGTDAVTLPVATDCTSPYALLGWNTKKDGSGTVYAPGTTVQPAADMSVYAQWGVTITYLPDGGTCPTASKVVPFGKTYALPSAADCTKASKSLASWTLASFPGVEFLPATTYTAFMNLTFTAKWAKEYNIGDTGPGGGIVFYKDLTKAVGQRYLEAAPNTWSEKAADPQTYWTNAKTIAAAYTGGGKSDWFLPSQDQLNALYKKRSTVGGFASDLYWSSTNHWSVISWAQAFGKTAQGFTTGAQVQWNIFSWAGVRPVRAF